MAKVTETKWYAKDEFTYKAYHFFKDQEIKGEGLTDADIKGMNDLVYSKSIPTDLEVEEKGGKK